MRDQEIIGLWESYQQVCETETARGPRLIDAYDKAPYSDDAAVAKNPVKMKKKGPKMVGVIQREEVDLFDIILEHLVSEGYADTNENALVIMANMSEEWRQSIVEADMTHPKDRKEPITVDKSERPGVEGETYDERAERMKPGKKPKGWKPTGPKLKSGQRPGYAR